MKNAILFIGLYLWATILHADGLERPFTSDLCTFWPNQSNNYDWSPCCLEHDLYYWAGGEAEHREKVDQKLKKCVAEKSSLTNARLMFLGVRLGSLSPVKFGGKQWGNAWGDQVRDSRLSSQEIETLHESLKESDQNYLTESEIDFFIQKLETTNN